MFRYAQVFACITAIAFLGGCGKSAPDGADSDVKKLVLQIAKDKLKNRAARKLYEKKTGFTFGLHDRQENYASLKAKAKHDKAAKQVIEAVDRFYEKRLLSLEGIRTESVDDKAIQSKSSAKLHSGTNVFSIRYTAQLDKDGCLKVKLYGLKK